MRRVGFVRMEKEKEEEEEEEKGLKKSSQCLSVSLVSSAAEEEEAAFCIFLFREKSSSRPGMDSSISIQSPLFQLAVFLFLKM